MTAQWYAVGHAPRRLIYGEFFIHNHTGNEMKYVIRLKPTDRWAAAGVEWAGFADASGNPSASSVEDAIQFDSEAEAVLFGLAECTHAFCVDAITPDGAVVHGDALIDADGEMTDDMAETVVESVLDVMPPRVRDVATAAVRRLAGGAPERRVVTPDIVDDAYDFAGSPHDLPAFRAILGIDPWSFRPYGA